MAAATGLSEAKARSLLTGRCAVCGRSGLTPSITAAGLPRQPDRNQRADRVDDLLEREQSGVEERDAGRS